MLVKTVQTSVLLMLGFGLPNTAFAEIFKWVDDNGKVHYTDKRPAAHDSEKIEVKINTYKAVTYSKSKFDTGRKVVMYSTSWCAYCKKAKRYFNKHGIRFIEYDIEKNPEARKKFKEMGGTGVPVILVGKKRMNGFSETGFEKIYR